MVMFNSPLPRYKCTQSSLCENYTRILDLVFRKAMVNQRLHNSPYIQYLQYIYTFNRVCKSQLKAWYKVGFLTVNPGECQSFRQSHHQEAIRRGVGIHQLKNVHATLKICNININIRPNSNLSNLVSLSI